MKKFFFFSLFFLSNMYSANIIVNITPDTIHVGGVGVLSVYIQGLQADEIPKFPTINNKDEIYTIRHRYLHDNLAEYSIQFWESGEIKISSISVDISKNKEKIFQIKSDDLKIFIHSNINNHDGNIKAIKPMQGVRILSIEMQLFYYFLIIIGLIVIFYLWNKKRVGSIKNQYKNNYKKTIFNETIERIHKLNIPEKINRRSTEEFYIKLSLICRLFINEKYFIRATEMTSNELLKYFQSIGVERSIVLFWGDISANIDRAKYGGILPSINDFENNKKKIISIVKELNIYKQ